MSLSKALWVPSESFLRNAHLTHFSAWLKERKNLNFQNYEALWQWSVDYPILFWESVWNYFQIKSHTPYKQVLSDDAMPNARWFEGATLNYAEHIFRNKSEKYPAILFASERHELTALSWDALEKKTAALQTYLKNAGVQSGDRVAAYISNIPEATIAMLATVALGAVWSSCSPDFGADSVLDRFKQITPTVLVVVDGYSYKGKPFDRMNTVKEIREQLPSVRKVIVIPYLNENPPIDRIAGAVSWNEVMDTVAAPLFFTPVPFAHPIWILYSSGTTGMPKAITHSHGGMLLEHVKYLSLHNDVHPGETFFWFSTTGWMMWNFVQASLLVGATAVLYDGDPVFPDMNTLWKLAASAPIHHFGVSAPYLITCMKRGVAPSAGFDLSALRSIGSTGAPLPPEGFDYVYEKIKKEVWLCSMSGGTDICSAWVGGCPWKPVLEGEIQCRTLGCSMYAYDENGNIIYDKVGEMVVTKAMPCMPVFFWGDHDFERYHNSYFDMYPGVWRHGDWIKITQGGGLQILGRSDTTLKRQGIRIGTAEIYRILDKISEVKDSLIVHVDLPHRSDFMPLFVVLQNGEKLSESLKKQIRMKIRTECSPRHVPDEIIEAADIPYTISGKKMEAPVKKILMGVAADEAANKGAMRNPDALNFFIEFANRERTWIF